MKDCYCNSVTLMKIAIFKEISAEFASTQLHRPLMQHTLSAVPIQKVLLQNSKTISGVNLTICTKEDIIMGLCQLDIKQ